MDNILSVYSSLKYVSIFEHVLVMLEEIVFGGFLCERNLIL